MRVKRLVRWPPLSLVPAFRDIWGALKDVFGHVKKIFMSNYFPPIFMGVYFLLIGGVGVATGHTSRWSVLALCICGVASQVGIIAGQRTLDDVRSAGASERQLAETEKTELYERAEEYRRRALVSARIVERRQEELISAQERYDELLQARTEEIINEVHKRLTGDKPNVQHAFPDVPVAPQAPSEVQAPF